MYVQMFNLNDKIISSLLSMWNACKIMCCTFYLIEAVYIDIDQNVANGWYLLMCDLMCSYFLVDTYILVRSKSFQQDKKVAISHSSRHWFLDDLYHPIHC